MKGRTRRTIAAALAVVLAATLGTARAQAPSGDEDLPAISISGAGVQMLKLGVPKAEGDAGAAAVETMSKDMDITGLFQVLDPASFPAQLQSEGLTFSWSFWT